MYNYLYVHRPSKDNSVDEPCRHITPSDLCEHCILHQMLGPYCLCPMMDLNQLDFIKAAIYMWAMGPFAGQYIATCAQDKCGYFGKPALLWFQQ